MSSNRDLQNLFGLFTLPNMARSLAYGAELIVFCTGVNYIILMSVFGKTKNVLLAIMITFVFIKVLHAIGEIKQIADLNEDKEKFYEDVIPVLDKRQYFGYLRGWFLILIMVMEFSFNGTTLSSNGALYLNEHALLSIDEIIFVQSLPGCISEYIMWHADKLYELEQLEDSENYGDSIRREELLNTHRSFLLQICNVLSTGFLVFMFGFWTVIERRCILYLATRIVSSEIKQLDKEIEKRKENDVSIEE